MIIEDSAYIVCADACMVRRFDQLPLQAAVYCPRCEAVKDSIGHLRRNGVPSARTMLSAAGYTAHHFFACHVTTFSVTTFQKTPMRTAGAECIHFTDATHGINLHGRTDLSLRDTTKLMWLSAPRQIQ